MNFPSSITYLRPWRHVFFTICVVGLTLASCVSAGAATPSEGEKPSFRAWLNTLRQDALRLGVASQTLDKALADVEFHKRIVALDRRQFSGKSSIDNYLKRVVSDSRICDGARRYGEHRPLLKDVAYHYGVQPEFMVALWGVETHYGSYTGGFPVIDALATLAYDGRRADFFRRELLAALSILDAGHITLEDMNGSWAGAMGQSQFMPTTFLAHAQDHNKDGRKDIWRTQADVFASIAAYLKALGWDGRTGWGVEVTLPKDFDSDLAGLDTRLNLEAWRALGLRRADGTEIEGDPELEASVMIHELHPGSGRRAFLVYPNYRRLMQWNKSHFFATSVGMLADAISGVAARQPQGEENHDASPFCIAPVPVPKPQLSSLSQ